VIVPDAIAGLEVIIAEELWLELILGRGLHEIDLPLLRGFRLDGQKLRAVRGEKHGSAIGMVFGSIGGKRHLFPRLAALHP